MDEDEDIGETEIRKGIRKDLEELSRKIKIPVPAYQDWTPPKAADRKIYFKQLGINIPEGRLFHPSCGEDIQSFTMFQRSVTGFDFADPSRMPSLDKMMNLTGGRKTIGRRYSPNVASGPRIGNIGSICPPKILPEFDKSIPPHFIRRFYLDGVITFFTHIHSMSIFYYTGDSPGEGGSNQAWLGPTLFPLVLDRLLDEGLIVTCGTDTVTNEHWLKESPWRPIIKGGATFQFAGRKFQLLAPSIWQVTGI